MGVVTNHPRRRERASAVLTPITPAELRQVIDEAAITQADAAARCHAAERTMRDWLSGARRMPLSASECLMLSLMWPGPSGCIAPHGPTLRRWVRPEFAAVLMAIRPVELTASR